MKKIMILIAVLALIVPAVVFAAEQEPKLKTFEEITSGRAVAPITFRELMQIAYVETVRMFDGLMRQNGVQVLLGAQTLNNHPKPGKGVAEAGQWSFIVPEKREGFKKMMPNFEKVVHQGAMKTATLAMDAKWEEAYAAYLDVIAGCNNCHMLYREWTIDNQILKKAKEKK
jgi:hypothetical protein